MCIHKCILCSSAWPETPDLFAPTSWVLGLASTSLLLLLMMMDTTTMMMTTIMTMMRMLTQSWGPLSQTDLKLIVQQRWHCAPVSPTFTFQVLRLRVRTSFFSKFHFSVDFMFYQYRRKMKAGREGNVSISRGMPDCEEVSEAGRWEAWRRGHLTAPGACWHLDLGNLGSSTVSQYFHVAHPTAAVMPYSNSPEKPQELLLSKTW